MGRKVKNEDSSPWNQTQPTSVNSSCHVCVCELAPPRQNPGCATVSGGHPAVCTSFFFSS